MVKNVVSTAVAFGVLLGSAMARQSAPAPAKPAAEPAAAVKPDAAPKSVLDISVKSMDGKDVPLKQYAGQVLLIVNVASQCGLTERNYTQLEPLYEKYKDKGFRILAFPCNDFGAQEPGTHEEITTFCRDKYHGTYDLFGKIAVKGDATCPLYKYLTEHPDAKIKGPVQWNFQKYLIGRDGQVLEKFDPKVNPSDEKLTQAIEKALAAPAPAANKEAGKKGA